MSKARSIILSVELEGLTQAETARLYGVSRSWVSKLVARYRTHGEAAFEPRSRKPLTSPTATAAETVKLIIDLRDQLTNDGLDNGPDTIAWHLTTHHQTTVSVSTIRRRLLAAGRITPEPKKRPRSSYIRFEADQPNETWQSDFTHCRLANGTDREVIVWLDDHSRYALSATAHTRITGPIVVDTFTECAAEQGFPASILTDNGMVYTARFATGRGGRTALETLLAELGIEAKHSRPNHPTTCGKVERFHQTLKKWLAARPRPPDTPALQTLLDKFVDEYNHRRPHRSLNRRTPAVAYQLLPKAGPAGSTDDTHHRVRHDRIDKTGAISLRRAGQMHHISIGRAHTGTRVVMLINNLDIRVINHTTGELLRHLTLDPTRGYQPRRPTKNT